MGNHNSANEAKGAGQDVVKQTEKTSNPIYRYLDLKGGGDLMNAFRRCQAAKDYTEVDKMIQEDLKQFLYNQGDGKMVAFTDLVQKRKESRQLTKTTRNTDKWRSCCSSPLKKPSPHKNSEIQLINKSFSLDPLG